MRVKHLAGTKMLRHTTLSGSKTLALGLPSLIMDVVAVGGLPIDIIGLKQPSHQVQSSQ